MNEGARPQARRSAEEYAARVAEELALPAQVRQRLEDLAENVEAMVDPDNAPSAVMVHATEALVQLCWTCMEAESQRWHAAGAAQWEEEQQSWLEEEGC